MLARRRAFDIIIAYAAAIAAIDAIRRLRLFDALTLFAAPALRFYYCRAIAVRHIRYYTPSTPPFDVDNFARRLRPC